MEIFGIHTNPISISDILISLVMSFWFCVYLKWMFPSAFKRRPKDKVDETD